MVAVDLVALGWDADRAAAFDACAPPDARAARITRVDRGWVTGVTADGRVRLQLQPGGPSPVTGDWAVVSGTGEPTLAALLPRRTALVRTDPDAGTPQVVAADIDVVAIVVPADRPVNVRRLERAAAVAFASGADPVVVLSKIDTAPDLPRAIAAAGSVAGLPVFAVSARTGEGVGEVAELARPARTLALLGASGVGKSTLANRLVGDGTQATGELRDDGSGRHTTTARELLALPGGGALIDTPGVRSVGVWAARDGVARVFADIEALATSCRFGDCAHAGEPGCTVGAGIDEGRLDAERVAAWHALVGEAETTAALASAPARRRGGRRRGPSPGASDAAAAPPPVSPR